MQKLTVFLSFLCLAVGTVSAKIDTKKLEYTIPYIPVENRASILPEHNICSIAPRRNLRTISSPATVPCASRLPAGPTTI